MHTISSQMSLRYPNPIPRDMVVSLISAKYRALRTALGHPQAFTHYTLPVERMHEPDQSSLQMTSASWAQVSGWRFEENLGLWPEALPGSVIVHQLAATPPKCSLERNTASEDMTAHEEWTWMIVTCGVLLNILGFQILSSSPGLAASRKSFRSAPDRCGSLMLSFSSRHSLRCHMGPSPRLCFLGATLVRTQKIQGCVAGASCQ